MPKQCAGYVRRTVPRARPGFLVFLVICAWSASGCRATSGAETRPSSVSSASASATPGFGKRKVRTELYFGLSRKGAEDVTADEWKAFLDEVVTPLFPMGFTIVDAGGQWKSDAGVLVRERSEGSRLAARRGCHQQQQPRGHQRCVQAALRARIRDSFGSSRLCRLLSGSPDRPSAPSFWGPLGGDRRRRIVSDPTANGLQTTCPCFRCRQSRRWSPSSCCSFSLFYCRPNQRRPCRRRGRPSTTPAPGSQEPQNIRGLIYRRLLQLSGRAFSGGRARRPRITLASPAIGGSPRKIGETLKPLS